jgi:hypothetical protein
MKGGSRLEERKEERGGGGGGRRRRAGVLIRLIFERIREIKEAQEIEEERRIGEQSEEKEIGSSGERETVLITRDPEETKRRENWMGEGGEVEREKEEEERERELEEEGEEEIRDFLEGEKEDGIMESILVNDELPSLFITESPSPPILVKY